MIEINSLKIYYKENSLYNFIKINIRLFSVFWMLFFVVDGFAVTRTWDGGAGTLVWTTAANWSGDAIPVAGDDVVFNTTGIFNITSVPILSLNSLTITSGNVTFSSLSSSTLTIGGIVGIDFAISNGASFVLGTNLSITMATSSTADIRGAFTINASRTWTITYSTTCTVGSIGSITNSGTITGATAAKLIFEDNSSYTHAQNGGAIPTADWNGATGTSTSTCYITGMVATAPTGVNQNFYNLVWNCASQTGSANMNGSLTILNNFSVSNTNTGSLFVGVGSGQINRTVTINGNMTLTAGRFYVNGSSSTGTNALIVNGSTNINGGTFAIHSSGLSTSSASFTAGDIIIANGATFDCGLSSNVTTINFKGSVTNTGTGIFKSSSTTPAIIFNGNGSTQIYNMSSSGYNNTNLLLWSIASGAVVQLNSNITLPKGSQSVLSTFTVSGTLDFGTNSSNELYVGIGLGFSSNSGDLFTLNSGGTLKITSVNGILASGSSIGNIRTVGSGKLSLDQAGNYHYIGDAAQVTGAALPVSITGSLVINNRSNVSGTGVSLSQATTIASPGVLTLTAGVLTTTTNLLSITNTSAAAIIGGNSTSFVNGPLRWTVVNSGGVNYKFQIGKSGNYLPLNVGSPVGTTPVITAQAYNANSNGSAGSGLERISNTEYWSISNTGTLTSSTISLGKENIGVNNAISSSTTLNGTYTDNLGTCSITNTLITSNTIKATNSSGSFLSPTYFVMSSKTCSAAMKYWAGAGSTVIGATNGTDFNEAANWSSDSVNKIDTSAPASCHDVTMSTNVALNLTLSENTRIKSLTITNGNNDVSLTALAPYNFEISSNITNTGNMLFGNNTSIILNGTSTLQIIGSSNDKALTFNNLQISNANGVKANVNIEVNGVLNLAAANPDATNGLLDMVIDYGDYAGGAYTSAQGYTVSVPEALTNATPALKDNTSTYNNLNSAVLTLGASATTIGSGDVTGKIRRTSFVSGTPYSFGNINTQLTFTSVTNSALPTQITVVATRGTKGNHVDKVNAVKRMYQILRTDGASATRFTVRLPYEDTELNGNTIEDNLVLWDHHIPYSGITPHEHGKTSNSNYNNYIELSNHGLFYLAVENDVNFSKYWMISNQESIVPTWLGAVPGGSWEIPSNWTSGIVPTDVSSVIIPNAITTANDPVLANNITIGTIEIQTNGIFTADDKIISIKGGPADNGGRGSWNNNGIFNAGTSSVVFDYSDATISGTTTFNNVTINNGKKVSILANAIATIGGIITNNTSSTIETFSTGTLKVTDLTLNDNFTFTNNGTLEVSGSLTDSRTYKNYGGLVRYTGTSASQSVVGGTYNHLDLSAAAVKSFSSNPTVGGDFTISGGTVTSPILFKFNGTTTQNIVGLPYNNIEFSGNGNKVFTSNGSVSGDSEIIFSNGSAIIDFDGVDNDKNFILKSDATGTAQLSNVGNFSLIGNVIVERYLLNDQNKRLWRLLTVPVKGTSNNKIFETWQNNGVINGTTGTDVWGPVSSYSPESNGMYYLPVSTHNFRKYSNGAWYSVTNTKTEELFGSEKNNTFLTFIIKPAGSGVTGNGGTGVTGSSPTTLIAKGSLLSGPQNYTIANTNYHLIGNPYASPIDFENLITTAGPNGNTVTEKIWILDPKLGDFGNYVTWDPEAGYSNVNSANHIAGTKIIQSGQGFFVKGKSGATSTNFEIKESDKIASNSYIFGRTASINYERIRVNLDKITNNISTHKDACVAVFYNEASNAVTEKDVQKFSNPVETLSFYNGTTSLSSEHRSPLVDNDVLFIRLTQAVVNSTYKIKINTENFNFSGSAIFHDLKLGTTTTIPLDGSVFEYSFNVTNDATTQGTRFKIVFTTSILGIEDNINALGVMAYPNPTTSTLGVILNAGNLIEGSYNYKIVNILGQEIQNGIFEKVLPNQEVKVRFNQNISSGWYSISILNKNKIVATMPIIVK